MVTVQMVPKAEFDRIRCSSIERETKLSIIADMCRINTLAAVKHAGSGHLGSSLSAMDIVVYLYHEILNSLHVGLNTPDRDIYFSSKGHDVPGLYSVLYSFGVLPQEKLLRLRRLNGLHGHPDIETPGIESNSGSLGMGISKGKGLAWALRHTGRHGRVYVLTGDGELQEGQIWESLQTTRHQKINNLIVIVDHNKVQSDRRLPEIVDLGDLEAKFRSFGWAVTRCDGHSVLELDRALKAPSAGEAPRLVIADTIKGKGVSFMEHPAALATGCGLYPWHAGAPDDDSFQRAHAEIVGRVNGILEHCSLARLVLERAEPDSSSKSPLLLAGEPLSQAAEERFGAAVSQEYVSRAFGETLAELGARRSDVVVLDADLASDCKLRGFERRWPERFVENGIAEQDMVSMAGGIARMGLLPVVNSFAAFLASRANEQIYNNASEKTKVIYALHYSGLIPAGPGKSHQSLRDISLLGALPNMLILQPGNASETRQVVEWCIEQAEESCAIRLAIGPSPRLIELPPDYRVVPGRGVILRLGTDAVIFAYGPVMLHEALIASELLEERGFSLRVVNMPWLNHFDFSWLTRSIADCMDLYVLEDHASVGGLADRLLVALHEGGALSGRRLTTLAVEGYPACGTPAEALAFHRLDGRSLAERILAAHRKLRKA